MEKKLATLRHEFDRVGCAVRYCGPLGLIFTEDHAGGVNVRGQEGFHYWTDTQRAYLDPKEVVNCLSELPAHSGEFAVRRVLSSLAHRE